MTKKLSSLFSRTSNLWF